MCKKKKTCKKTEKTKRGVLQMFGFYQSIDSDWNRQEVGVAIWHVLAAETEEDFQALMCPVHLTAKY